MYFCSQCYSENRKEHRKETLDNSEDKERILEIDREKRNRYCRNSYAKKKISVRKIRFNEEDIPKIKNSIKEKTEKKIKEKSYSFLTFQESQLIFRNLTNKGYTPKEAKNILTEFKERLSDTRKFMKELNKSEEDIKIEQNRLLEELWKS